MLGTESLRIDLADARAGRAKRLAFENSAVFESENRAHGGTVSSIAVVAKARTGTRAKKKTPEPLSQPGRKVFYPAGAV